MLKEQQSALAPAGDVTAICLQEPLFWSIAYQAARFVVAEHDSPERRGFIWHCVEEGLLLDFTGIL